MSGIEFRKVAKSFGKVDVIPPLDLEIRSGEFTVLLGPSGCGKTTLLRMIAGLEQASAGDIHIAGQRVNDRRASQRDISMVFQSYALYPHLNVAQNLGFPLRVGGMKRDDIARKVEPLARKLGLAELLERKPKELSGGQRQRVALGRALIRDPQVFLFDEPLSNLDAAMREEMRSELIAFHAGLGKTMVYVTHDQIEAMTMAQRIVVMSKGVIQQIGSPRQVYKEPVNMFVARFIGSPAINLLRAEKREGGLAIGGSEITVTGEARWPGAPALMLGCRPETIGIGEIAEPHFALPARIQSLQPLGPSLLVEALCADGVTKLSVLTPWKDQSFTTGSAVTLAIPRTECLWFDPQSGNRIH
ncbi:MAG TPA: ABC transporter ATP-binding protein [Nordella sp.]|nr:ABC transporter ATP-binding protein [Nordella sp.]